MSINFPSSNSVSNQTNEPHKAKKQAAQLQNKAAELFKNSISSPAGQECSMANLDSASAKTPLDSERVFLEIVIIDQVDGAQSILFVPASLLPAKERSDFLATKTSKDEYSKDPKLRFQQWRKDNPDSRVHEILQVKPFKISGMRSIEFMKKFKLSFDQVLKQALMQEGLRSNEISFDTDLKDSNKGLVIDSSDSLSMISGAEVLKAQDPEGLYIIRLIKQFKSDLVKIINEFGQNLLPEEPLILLWDSLSQCLLKKHLIDEKEKSQLAEELILLWNRVHLDLFFLKQRPECSANIISTLNQFENKIADPFPGLSKDLKRIHWPLIKLLDAVNVIQSRNSRQLYHKELDDLFSGTLNLLGNITVKIDSSRSIIREWLENRVKTIIHLQKVALQSFSKSKLIEVILSLVSRQEWGKAYHFIDALANDLEVLTGNLFRNPGFISSENYPQIRIFYFIKALRQDFEFILREGLLFNKESEIFAEQKAALLAISEELASTGAMGLALYHWARKLKKQNQNEVLEAFQEFQKAWKKLKNLRLNLTARCPISDLTVCIEKEEYQSLAPIYLVISNVTRMYLSKWENAIKKINTAINELQQFCFLAMADPSLPRLEASVLRSEFKIFNIRLELLVRPVAYFIHTFRYLIAQDQPLHDYLNLNVFSEDDKIFKSLEQLSEKLNSSPQGFIEIKEEIEDPVELALPYSESKDLELQMANLEVQVNEIFNQTKIHKITSQLHQFLKELKVKFSQKHGARHLKLFINGVLVTMPTHYAEWKLGTSASIQNQVLDGLRSHLQSQDNK